MSAAISWSNYSDVLTKVVSFLDALKELLISFRPHDYNTHGYITLPAKDAKDYKVCSQRKILWDKFSWFGFERENRERMRQSFNYHDKVELPRKMQQMQTFTNEYQNSSIEIISIACGRLEQCPPMNPLSVDETPKGNCSKKKCVHL